MADLAGPGEGRMALDLGCGAGIETRHLVEHGWRVLGLDADPTAPGLVAATVGDHPDVRVHTTDFRTVDLPAADLVHASLCLPFLAPPDFASVWPRVLAALHLGAWLAVRLCGVRDSWPPADQT